MADLTWFLFLVTIAVIILILLTGVKKIIKSEGSGKRKRVPKLPISLWELAKASIDPSADFVQLFAQLVDSSPVHSIFLKLPRMKIVIINDLELGKELFSTAAVSARPETEMWQFHAKGNYGIATSTGKVWEEQRRFTFRTLKEAGLGNKSMETLIEKEVEDFIQGLQGQVGQVIAPKKTTSVHLFNTLWVLLTGERFVPGENEASGLLNSIYEGFTAIMKYPNVLLLTVDMQLSRVGIFAKLILPFWTSMRMASEGMLNLRTFCEKLVDKQRRKMEQKQEKVEVQNVDSEHVETNFVDAYMKEIEAATEQSTFYKEEGWMNLIATCGDLFIAGGETAATVLCWAMLHLVRNPEVQSKIHEELDRVVGRERRATLHDRPRCHYLEAFIYEVMRFTPASIFSLPHVTTEDLIIRGDYFVPKGTTVGLNIAAIHFDKKLWGDPENFRPSRFLSEENGTMIKREAMVIFSIGKRKCPGYQFALDNLFLFTSAMCQTFNFKKNPALGDKIPLLISEPSAMNTPKEFHIVVENRLNAE